MSNFRAEYYDPLRHRRSLEIYMARTDASNNRSPKALRLSEYEKGRGCLILALDQEDCIGAVTSVLLEETPYGLCGKIYGRLNILKGVPHSIIDRFFEPMIFSWCEQQGLDRLYLTVNEGQLRTLDWVCRRMGEKRCKRRPNLYSGGLGERFRVGFRPLNQLIYERHCWQYAIYYSLDGQWFLDRQQRPLDPKAEHIMRREFPRETQNWL